jgi:hypothetical protein
VPNNTINISMNNRVFPIFCIDDFFNNPEEIRNLALSQNFYSSPEGTYPGKRTDHLHKILPDFFDQFTKKLFSIFYNFEDTKVKWIVSANFQLIESYDDSKLNEGWVHLDNNAIFAGIVYLNKNPNPNSGTSICDKIENSVFDNEQTIKHEFFQGNVTDTSHYINRLKTNNSNFTESVIFKNKFNRLVSFSGENYHKIDNFSNGVEPRLTLAFFVHKIEANWYPLTNFNFSNI